MPRKIKSRMSKVVAKEKSVSVADKAKMTRLVNKVRLAQKAIEEEQAIIDEAMPELEQIMSEANVAKHATNLGLAEFITPAGRATNVIDVVKYRDAVEKDDDFYGSVSVSNTKAKELLGAKELAKMTTKILPNKKEPVLKVNKL